MAKKSALFFGFVLVIIGLLGIFSTSIVGANGYFMTNTAHDIVHLALGILLVWAGVGAANKSGMMLKLVGLIAVIIAILGLWMGSPILGLFASNSHSDWLHLVVGILLIILGMHGEKHMMAAPMSQPMM